MDGGGAAPTADAGGAGGAGAAGAGAGAAVPGATPVMGDGAAPVQAHVHHHAHDHHGHHDPFFTNGPHRTNTDSTLPKSRPISVNELRESQKSWLANRDDLSTDIEHYFVGPRDLSRHTKWPTFLRMHGSILPRLILPLFFVAAWSTVITLVTMLRWDLSVASILLTVLGFVVGLALSFRSSTAYERYNDGRKYWTQLIMASRNIARLIWLHTREREGELGKDDLLKKLTALNLVQAFAVALKHNLRFEPTIAYADLFKLVGHLDTFARDAHDPDLVKPLQKTPWKAAGEYMGVSFAESNPRKLIKRAKKPLGHLPMEILNHLSAYVNHCTVQGLFYSATYEGQLITAVNSLSEVLAGSERVRDTPLPEAYCIAISQIAWIYILVLPFQLVDPLNYLAIPGSVVAAYIILSFVAIGRELENPFGDDVNDLPLDSYCKQLSAELDIITATPPAKIDEITSCSDNLVMYPLSEDSYEKWKQRSVAEIREALKYKVISTKKVSGSEESDSAVIYTEATVKA
ncbi:UPF0187 domain membrane protein [Talaromyces proteolyticus]|uniref:UPF0187 domain membrane protein n=1 Tax=Talaromyces proteolyticus TaxID=1131652 RepID=A0AAD4KWN8_9EURO|nr:UPF0187 domain membrane protein [Talaromyces proteolyticus]KAH8702553.1 UPF0187 domain membrane protein [Talaromyces proteolyticus]